MANDKQHKNSYAPAGADATPVASVSRAFESLADLLEYPSDGWRAQLESCRQTIKTEATELAPAFERFYQQIAGESLHSLQEIYTRTFDLNPVCTLEVGYHLFGENYKRGLFLANLHETETPFDLGQQHQLPDYLPVLLRLLVKLEDRELRDALIVECILPALEKMLETLGQIDNPYSHLIEAVHCALKVEAPGIRQSNLKSMNEVPELYRISARAAVKKEQRL